MSEEPTCQYTGHTEPYRDCGDCPYLEDCGLQMKFQEAASADQWLYIREHEDREPDGSER